MTQIEFNAWIRQIFNLWTASDVDAAVKAEREACEKVAENCGAFWISKAIRARGEQA